MEQVEDTQHTQQDKESILKSLLLQGVVPLWTETDFLKERNKEKPSANNKTTRYQQLINRQTVPSMASVIYVPLSFIAVIKCTGEFLPHQRKFVNGIHCRWKKWEGTREDHM
jgi:hypothetical protein